MMRYPDVEDMPDDLFVYMVYLSDERMYINDKYYIDLDDFNDISWWKNEITLCYRETMDSDCEYNVLLRFVEGELAQAVREYMEDYIWDD